MTNRISLNGKYVKNWSIKECLLVDAMDSNQITESSTAWHDHSLLQCCSFVHLGLDNPFFRGRATWSLIGPRKSDNPQRDSRTDLPNCLRFPLAIRVLQFLLSILSVAHLQKRRNKQTDGNSVETAIMKLMPACFFRVWGWGVGGLTRVQIGFAVALTGLPFGYRSR